jgi:hypothetical protein
LLHKNNPPAESISQLADLSYLALILMADNAVFIAAAVIRAVVKRILNKQTHFVLVQVLLTDGVAKFFIVFKIHAVIAFAHGKSSPYLRNTQLCWMK